MPYNIVKPINAIFNTTDDLREISELVGRMYTPQQMVNLGYIMISSLPIFHSDVRRCFRHDPAN